jgi:hypothetical protein
MQPTLKFKIDPEQDWTVLQGFLRDAEFDGGRNLEWAVYAKYPEMKTIVSGRMTGDAEQKARDFIRDYFTQRAIEIEANLDVYRSAWLAKQDAFFALVQGIFGDRSWPPGMYEAYPTLWGMFPRSLETKTFQVPALYENKPYVDVIVAHEMLHFMFYDYFYATYPEHDDPEDNFLAWNVSEIFNSVVQNSRVWLGVFGLETMTYPEHEKIEAEMSIKYPIVNQDNLASLTQDILEIAKGIKMPG